MSEISVAGWGGGGGGNCPLHYNVGFLPVTASNTTLTNDIPLPTEVKGDNALLDLE